METTKFDYIISATAISSILAISITLVYFVDYSLKVYLGVYRIILVFFSFLLFYGLITVFLLRLIRFIYPFEKGIYTMRDSQFTLWKFNAVIGELGKIALSIFFPVFLKPLYYSLFGARIGRNVAIGGKLVDPYLTVIEDFAIIGQDSVITAHTMTFGKFIISPVTIGRGSTVGIGAIIMPGVSIGPNSVVLPGSVVLMDTHIPANEIWGGIPCKRIKSVDTGNT